MMRCNEKGWQLIAMHDPAGRRGVWIRFGEDGPIEFCAGREGDDAYACVTGSTNDLKEVLEYGIWAFDMAEEQPSKPGYCAICEEKKELFWRKGLWTCEDCNESKTG